MNRSFTAVAVASTFLARHEARVVSLPTLHHLVYLAHGWHLGIHRLPLVTGAFSATADGPRHDDLEAVFVAAPTPLKPRDHPRNVFSRYDRPALAVMTAIYESYVYWSLGELAAHLREAGTPWHRAFEARPDDPIPNASLEAWYGSLAGRVPGRLHQLFLEARGFTPNNTHTPKRLTRPLPGGRTKPC